jgi:hypothetical protein
VSWALTRASGDHYRKPDEAARIAVGIKTASARWSTCEVAERGYDGFDLLTRQVHAGVLLTAP